MKRKTWALTFILALLFSLASATKLAKESKANPYPTPGIEIALRSPENRTYNNNTIPVGFTSTEVHLRVRPIFTYDLDKGESKSIQNFTTVAERVPINPQFTLIRKSSDFLLFNLSEGWHKLTVYCYTYDLTSYSDKDTVDFFVDTTPIVTFLSLENATFETVTVPLNFTVNQAFSKISYTLDGQDNVTISGNTTLTELPNGDHNVTVYVTDETGNTGTSKTMLFTVAEPEPESTLLAAASVATTAVVSTVFLFWLKTKKNKGANKHE
jgi:hypothetical protein